MSEQTLRLLRPAGHGPDGPLWAAVLHGRDGGPERVLAEQLGADVGTLRRIGDAAQLQARHPGPTVVQARALLRVGDQRFLIAQAAHRRLRWVNVHCRLVSGPRLCKLDLLLNVLL
jgi:hypothetical protein